MNTYKIYYNEDCQKYGIKKLVNDYRGEHWTQILVYKGKEIASFTPLARKAHCYTEYSRAPVPTMWLKF